LNSTCRQPLSSQPFSIIMATPPFVRCLSDRSISAPKCYRSAPTAARVPRLLTGVDLCRRQLFRCCQNSLPPPTYRAAPVPLARLALPQLGSAFPLVPGIPRGPAACALPLAVAAQRPDHFLAGLFVGWPALAVPRLHPQKMLHFSPDSPTPCPVPAVAPRHQRQPWRSAPCIDSQCCISHSPTHHPQPSTRAHASPANVAIGTRLPDSSTRPNPSRPTGGHPFFFFIHLPRAVCGVSPTHPLTLSPAHRHPPSARRTDP
jgi:hypothetical protein